MSATGQLISLSTDDVEHYREAFDQYDEAHVGALSLSDVRLAMLDVGLRMSESEITEVLVSGALPFVALVDGKPKPLPFKAFLELVKRVRTLKLAHAPHQDEGSSSNDDADASTRTGRSQSVVSSTSRKGSRRFSSRTLSPMDSKPTGRRSAGAVELRRNVNSRWNDEMLVHVLQRLRSTRELVTEEAAAASSLTASNTQSPPTSSVSQPAEANTSEKILAQLEMLGCPYDAQLARSAPGGAKPPVPSAAPSALDIVRFIDAVAAMVSARLASVVQYVEAYSHDDVTVDSTALVLSSALDKTQAQEFDEAKIQRDLDELEQFTFDVEKDPQQRQGSDAFRAKTRDFPSFMFPTESICTRLDHLDKLHDQYEDLLAGKEFVLKSECPDGRLCGIQDVPEHRLAVTHPCFVDGPICPHRYRALHMKVYSHPDDANPTAESQLREMQKRLGVVELSGMELGDAGSQCIAHVLSRDKVRDGERRYTQVLMSGNHLTPVGAIPLLDACSQLTYLDLSSNALGHKNVALITSSSIGPSLQQLLARADKLTYLNLAKNKLSDRDARYITEALKTNTVLRHLDLRKNELGATFGSDMAAALSENRDLRELFVGWNRLESFGSAVLLQELKTSSTLEVIDMSWTGITDEGGKMIAELIVGSQTIKSLFLGHNNISADAATAIGKALIGNKSLSTLDLSFNPIGTRSCVDMIRDLKENTALELLDIRCVKAGEETLEEIKKTIKVREPKLPPNMKSSVLFSTSVAALDH